jgi:excinuclease UvrABC nuclease subunit
MSEYDLSSVPDVACVYPCYDRQGSVAYVGISNNLRSRIGQHFVRRGGGQPQSQLRF